MDREYWKARLPFIAAFVNGETLTSQDGTPYKDDLGFDLPPECYRIAKPKEKIPLEAEDWIKDGPWWVRCHEDALPTMVVKVSGSSIMFWSDLGSLEHQTHEQAVVNLYRRNATSDWMPCWKEKE